MKKTLFPVCLVGLACVAILAQTATAAEPPKPTPEQIAQRCIARVTEMANRCVNGNAEAADRAVAKIKELLAANNREAAVRVAREVSKGINDHTKACVEAIGNQGRECEQMLRKAKADEDLIKRVQDACKAQAARVRASRLAAVTAIHAALGDGSV